MIRSVRLQDFKTHVDTTVELGRLTILVGPNGSGKSSVLTALYLMNLISYEDMESWDSAPPTLAHLPRTGSKSAAITAEASDGSASLRLTRLRGGSKVRVAQQFLDPGEAPDKPDRYFLDVGLRALPPPATSETNILLRFDADRLAEPAPPTSNPMIAPDGYGLGAVIAEMILGGASVFHEIVADVRRIVPQVAGLRVRTVSVPAPTPTDEARTEGRMQLLVDFDHAKGIPAHSVSQGTLIAIGLLTVLHGERRPKLLLLDDIDTALHPRAQWEVIAALRRVLELDPELQIVATTHSAYLLDAVEPDEVRVLALDADGVTHCRRLTDHPRAEALLEVLSTGELLGSEGEDWVVEADADD